MSERQPRPYDDIARKWHALAERRRAHVVELRDSGRWQHYYTWDELLEALRERSTPATPGQGSPDSRKAILLVRQVRRL